MRYGSYVRFRFPARRPSPTLTTPAVGILQNRVSDLPMNYQSPPVFVLNMDKKES